MKSDLQLQRDVIDELCFEPSVDAAEIGVSAVNGVVTLSGFVKSYAEKIAADKAARRVDGARAAPAGRRHPRVAARRRRTATTSTTISRSSHQGGSIAGSTLIQM